MFALIGCNKISDKERSYGNIKVIISDIANSNQKYEALFDYYNNGYLENLLIIISPSASFPIRNVGNAATGISLSKRSNMLLLRLILRRWKY